MNSSQTLYLLALIISCVCLCYCAPPSQSSNRSGLSRRTNYSPKEVKTNEEPTPAPADKNLTSKCKDGGAVCSNFKTTMESYIGTIERNTEIFQQLTESVQEMFKKLSDSNIDCGDENTKEGETETTPTIAQTAATPSAKAPVAQRNTPSNAKPQSQPPTAAPETTPTIAQTAATPSAKAPVAQRNTPSNAKPQSQPPTAAPEATPTETPEPPSDPVYKTYVGKDNEDGVLRCDESKGHLIKIIHAYYGPSDGSKCSKTKGEFTPKSGDRYEKIRSICGDWTQSTCSFKVDSSELGDVCEGVPKKLRVNYYCSVKGVLGLRRKPSIEA